MQQRRESRVLVSAGCLVDSRERGWEARPALGPGLPALTESVLGPAPSLHAPRLLRRLHQYYEQVRRPTSARRVTSVFPRDASPPAAMPTAPVGPPGSRRRPSVREAIHDPGGASPSCVTTAYTWPSTTGTVSASTTFTLFGAIFPHPTRPLSTLRTSRYHDARKTRFRLVRYDPGRAGLAPACPSSVHRRTPGRC